MLKICLFFINFVSNHNRPLLAYCVKSNLQTTMETQEKIIKTLENVGKPMRPGEIADAAGLDKKEVEKEIKKLKTSGKIYSPKMCFYDIQK